MNEECNNNDQRFRGKVIVITGAGGNFGREGCSYFANRGAKIAALDNNPKTLQETIEIVRKQQSDNNNNEAGDKVIVGFTCDVTDVDSVHKVIEDILTSTLQYGDSNNSGDGRIDLLWNNAGYQGKIQPTLDYDPKDFATVMNINVTGMFILMQAIARQMSKQQKQQQQLHPYSIVNTSSVAGLRGTPAMIAYASSKAAVLAMTVSASKDLAPHGIRVNAISPALIGPGFMWTRQNELHAQSGSPYFDNDPDKVATNKVNSVPMKRLGSVHEVVKSVAFLLSDDSSYTTGTNLVVDGGMSSGLKA